MVAVQELSHIQKQQKNFWENMANHYPLPFDRKTLEDTQKIIAIAETAGVQIDGAKILDIGCGTGNYTLPLALRAAHVTGIDTSEKMLACCNRERMTRNFKNVSILQFDWREGNIESLSFPGAFDIVWASMTPAIRSKDDLAKMRRCAKKSCVYIGWGNIRKNELLEEIFAVHHRTFEPPPGAATIKAMLHAQGIQTQATLVRSHWDWQGTVEEACINAAGYLEASMKTELRYDIIRTIMSRHCQDSVVKHRTHVELEVLVWQEY